MAYNANASYEPPRRGYPRQPPVPAQNAYGHGHPPQGQHDDYYAEQAYDQGYDQQYGQGYDQRRGYGQDMRQARKPRSPGYNEAYDRGYQDPRDPRQQNYVQPNGNERQPRIEERQYDPRYQQRPERGRQPKYDQQPRQPREPAQERQYQMQESRPNPRAARQYQQEAPAQMQMYEQPPPTFAQPPRTSSRAEARPQTASQPDKSHEISNNSMAEWKAKEKARMHAAALAPETLAWDNAFPVFPTKREQSRAAEDRTGSDMTPRTSGEQARPMTSAGPRADERAAMSRNNSDPSARQILNGQQQLSRPPMEHKPYSFDPVTNRTAPAKVPSPSQLRQQQSQLDRQLSEQAPGPVQASLSQPQRQQQQSPVVIQNERRQVPLQANVTSNQYREDQPPQKACQDQSYTHQQGQSPVALQNERRQPLAQAPVMSNQYREEQPPQQAYQAPAQSYTRQPPPRGPMPQRIDTSQAQQTSQPSYMDHQPLSPGQIPERPSTSQSARSRQPMVSPSSAHPQASQGYFEGQVAPQRKASGPQRGRQPSIDEVYGGYQNRVPPPVTAPSRTRDEEIEHEMPDFDSAAPGGTSLLHKRSQHSERSQAAVRPPPQPLANQQPQGSVQSLPLRNQQLYQGQETSVSLPTQAGIKHKQGGITEGFVFGVPGESPTSPTRYEDPYQPRSPTYGEQRPPQPPFANERPRRSMDDARQMPYRQGPSPQSRHPQNGQLPRGPPQPHQRRPMDREHAGQPLYAEPLGDSIRSAPPTRHNFQGAPGPYGAPLAQQRSAPDPPRKPSNPDALPQHPTPIRPGLMEDGPGQPSKPPPVRNYNDSNHAPLNHQRQVSTSNDLSTQPVTKAELEQLRRAVDANPNDQKRALRLAKKLAEAATVLASDGGRADQRTATGNRDRYFNEAHKRVKKLVAAGYPDAQFYMADCHGSGSLGMEVDPKEAFKLYQAAAKAGHPQAAYRTAMCCELGPQEGGGTSQDYAKAAQWYRRGAALGDPDAMFKIGIILLKGLLGQQRNITEAVNFLKRTVQAGTENPHALHELAQLYESTNTNPEIRNKVVADDKYALDLYQQAASAGHRSAQFRLGQAYEYGSMNLVIDNRASITWYTKAAAQGEHQAELALSGWYLTGAEGILEHSDTEAYLWARKAAASEPPLAKAMFAMGYFAETGIGCPANMEEAKRWYGRAATYKFPKAQERLEELRRGGNRTAKPVNGKLSRKDQKRDEAECALM